MHELSLDHVKGPGRRMQPEALIGGMAYLNTISTITVEKNNITFLGRKLI